MASTLQAFFSFFSYLFTSSPSFFPWGNFLNLYELIPNGMVLELEMPPPNRVCSSSSVEERLARHGEVPGSISVWPILSLPTNGAPSPATSFAPNTLQIALLWDRQME